MPQQQQETCFSTLELHLCLLFLPFHLAEGAPLSEVAPQHIPGMELKHWVQRARTHTHTPTHPHPPPKLKTNCALRKGLLKPLQIQPATGL